MAHKTLDLKGKTISKNADSWSCIVCDGADAIIDIKGDGVITTAGDGHAIPLWAKNQGTINIYNGTIINAFNAGECVYILNGGQVNIYGGVFKTDGYMEAVPVAEFPTENPEYTFALKDGDLYAKNLNTDGTIKSWDRCYLLNVNQVNPVEYPDYVKHIQTYGGKFYGCSPEIGDDVLGGTFVPDGYTVVKSKEATTNGYINVYTVVKA